MRGLALAAGGIVASALLCGLYARGGWAWPLGFVALVPWLLAQDALRSTRAALLSSLAMSAAFVVTVLGWFAPAVAEYTGLPVVAAGVLLVAVAPLLQPQFVLSALARRLARDARPTLRAAVAIAAWLAAEWVIPRLFGDTLGHGLHPSRWLRQFADVAGGAGLTLALLIANEAIAALVRRRSGGLRAIAGPVALALAAPALLAAYGASRLAMLERLEATPGTPLRIGLVQASIVDYERLRREMGAYAVVRHVLDTHYALSEQARANAGVDALVWSETVYPTTFLNPRSEDGALLDMELVGFVRRIGVPLVFGTYERDVEGEYNVAAFVDPARGPLGAYRKTRLFPLTERVPPALDSPALRSALPWAGTWRRGDGARVFPLAASGGREVPVVPLICRDDVDARLAIDGARLGAQLIVGLSNDAWFTTHPLGAELHLQVAAFRSIETRLPQVRATTNGMSAVIGIDGGIVASTRMDERTVLVGDVIAREPPMTPVVRAGPWLGPLATWFIAAIAAGALWRLARRARGIRGPAANAPDAGIDADAGRACLLMRWQRALIAALRVISRGSVLALGAIALFGDDAMRGGVLQQMRLFSALVLGPELLAAALYRATAARWSIDGGDLLLDTRRRRIAIPVHRIVQARAWRWPLPSTGVDLVLAASGRFAHGIALRDAIGFAERLTRAGAQAAPPAASERRRRFDEALALPRRRLDHPIMKFVLFPLLPALPAFRLHQHIAYGGTFGEYYTFGAGAYLSALGLWWASWAVALVLLAGGLRLLVEAGAFATLAVAPARTRRARALLRSGAQLAYYLGVPAWLLARLLLG